MSKKITPQEQARYADLAARAEAGDFGPIDPAAGPASIEAERSLDALLADVDESAIDQSAPTPPAPADAVTAAEVRAKLGRPTLSGTVGTGKSRRRQTRLPMDLDALLEQRIAATGSGESEILRDALAQYLRGGQVHHRRRERAS